MCIRDRTDARDNDDCTTVVVRVCQLGRRVSLQLNIRVTAEHVDGRAATAPTIDDNQSHTPLYLGLVSDVPLHCTCRPSLCGVFIVHTPTDMSPMAIVKIIFI